MDKFNGRNCEKDSSGDKGRYDVVTVDWYKLEETALFKLLYKC